MSLSSCKQCSSETKDEKEISSLTGNFATSYFNYDFNSSLNFCTPESRKWLEFISSNITQEDVDSLRGQKDGAKCELDGIEFIDDTTATATYIVSNFLKIDTLGKAARAAASACYKIPVVKRNGKWLIKMEGLLQSERQNPD